MLDLLVDVTGETTPWFPGSLVADLDQLLGRRVQVVISRLLSPLIRDSVFRESVPLHLGRVTSKALHLQGPEDLLK